MSDRALAEQYDAFPYPARDPADEARRLIEGSPSHPVEIDHFLFGGRRDWSAPFRALVAGGGTGDGLVMLAQKLVDIGCPAEIVYADLSPSARRIAEARITARGLDGVRFVTGDFTEVPGRFDYIDCCGVLHHMEDPPAGLAALAGKLAPGGGMGLMVYAPLGRTGVYPLQAAFRALLAEVPLAERPARARQVLAALPEHAWIHLNPHLGDHLASDAGLHDLLLNARDRPYTIAEFVGLIEGAGLGLVSPVEPGRYDPARHLPPEAGLGDRLKALGPVERMALAENLSGDLKTHVVYVAEAGRAAKAEARPDRPDAVPRLAGLPAAQLARQLARGRRVSATMGTARLPLALGAEAAPLVAAIDGRRSLGDIAAATGRDWLAFAAAWAPVHRELTAFNLMHYSRGARR